MKSTELKSIEEKVEDQGKKWLSSYNLSYFNKTDSMCPEIDTAMRDAPSKSGGTGGNYPDIRLLLTCKNTKVYPIMIEAKGTRGKLVKFDSNNDVDKKMVILIYNKNILTVTVKK